MLFLSRFLQWELRVLIAFFYHAGLYFLRKPWCQFMKIKVIRKFREHLKHEFVTNNDTPHFFFFTTGVQVQGDF